MHFSEKKKKARYIHSHSEKEIIFPTIPRDRKKEREKKTQEISVDKGVWNGKTMLEKIITVTLHHTPNGLNYGEWHSKFHDEQILLLQSLWGLKCYWEVAEHSKKEYT